MFNFRLRPLQKIRENTRRERQAELARAMEAESFVREKIESLTRDIAGTKEEGRRLISGCTGGSHGDAGGTSDCADGTKEVQINVDFLVGLRRHEAWLLAQKQEAEQKLEQVLAEVERRRLAVVEADKEVKILEKLHEKLKDKYDTEQAAKEIVAFDEIAMQRAGRGMQNAE